MTKWIKYKLTKNDWQKIYINCILKCIFMKRYKYFLDSLFFVQCFNGAPVAQWVRVSAGLLI